MVANAGICSTSTFLGSTLVPYHKVSDVSYPFNLSNHRGSLPYVHREHRRHLPML